MPPGVIDFVYKEVELISDTLERKLGIWSVVIISLSAMLGSGLFVLPALATLLTTILTFKRFGSKAALLDAAAAQVVTEIYKFRMHVGR